MRRTKALVTAALGLCLLFPTAAKPQEAAGGNPSLFITTASAVLAAEPAPAATTGEASPLALRAISEPHGLAPRIVNGLPTSGYPEVGMLLGPGLCTGTLIGCRTFLTAAHCVAEAPDPGSWLVFFQHGVPHAVADIAIHPGYKDDASGHDLAVLRLSEPVVGISPAPINTASRPSFGTPGSIVGFGRIGGAADGSGIKRVGEMRTGPCPAHASGGTHLCWEFSDPGPPGSDSGTCRGDSGGPLFITPGGVRVLAGVTSTGNASCLPPNRPADADVYVDRSWIESVAGGDLGSGACGALPSAGSPGAPVAARAGILGPGNLEDDYSFQVPADTELLVVTLNGELESASDLNDFDLSVGRGASPSSGSTQCSSETLLALEVCTIPSPEPGTWWLRALRFEGAGEYQATITTFLAGGSGGSCQADDTTLCLFGGRFAVRVFFRRPGTPGEGFATVGRREDQWGTFFFFGSGGIPHALVTMGPRPNGMLAVQIPPLQAAEVEVTIQDFRSGTTRTYRKPQGNLEAIIDAGAFPQ